jgi:hypothetical protein
MAAPTLANVYTSTWSDTSTASEAVTGVAWNAGDLVVVMQGVEANLTTVVLNPPTNASLTFSELALEVNDDNANNECYVGAFAAIAGSSETGQTITSTTSTGNSMRGMRVLVYSGSDGVGNTATIDGSTAKTISLIRGGANSHVAVILWDWDAINDVAVNATPAGTVQNATHVSGRATGFCCTYGDQGAAGTTSYGLTDHTGTASFSGIAVEILGTAGGGATLRRYSLTTLGVG